MFTPRTTKAVATTFLAKVLARTKLTDTSLGSVLERWAWSHGEDISFVEQRIAAVRDSFNFLSPSISDTDLDERAGEFPPATQIPRLTENNATASVLSVTRAETVDVQVLPAKTIVSRSSDGVRYRTLQAISFAPGIGTVQNIPIVCLTPGESGNCSAGAIDTAVGAPSWVVGVSNTTSITSGVSGETKSEYQIRLAKYVQSLAKSQMAALEFAASTYRASDGSRVKFAKGYLDHAAPGFSYMILDDGSGMQNLTRAGVEATGVVPEYGIRTLWHEAPATAPIGQVHVALAGGGVKTLVEGTDYTSVYERGLILLKNGALAPGDTWVVSGYQVRTGLFTEVQRLLDGDMSSPNDRTGWTASGCRCIVRPPDLYYLFCDIHIVPKDGYDALSLAQAAQSLAIGMLQQLGPGEPLYVSRLVAALMALPNILAVHVYKPQTNTPLGDVYVGPTTVVRGQVSTINTIPTLP